ncbi:MAG: nuclear transport factor 2 family protein [Mesorhizobium sp.]|nr:nuclear transport factor 2 family protein [Mesorhizobium sp.]
MTNTLPEQIAAYFAAKNRHDIDAMLVPFAPDAIVRDEGRTHTGPNAIREWMVATTAKYKVSVELREALLAEGVWTISALVAGNFPGSPATLHYRFTLAEDRIVGLEIG